MWRWTPEWYLVGRFRSMPLVFVIPTTYSLRRLAGIETELDTTLGPFLDLLGPLAHQFHPAGAVGSQGGNLQSQGVDVIAGLLTGLGELRVELIPGEARTRLDLTMEVRR